MTVPYTGPPVDAADVDAALAVLKERGMRLSASRRLVLEALFVAGGPVTAESIARGLEGHVTPNDLASVYRNLETLEQVGLVRHLHLGHGPSRYVLAGAGDREYLVCERCGAVRGVPSKQLDGVRRALVSRFGWTVTFTHSPIVGLCADCSRTIPPDHADRGRTRRHSRDPRPQAPPPTAIPSSASKGRRARP